MPIAWRLEVHDTLGSTSDWCLAAAGAGEPAGLAVLALRQSAGRGSRGRAWQSPVGNLHLSLLVRPDEAVVDAGIWPLLTSLALHDALAPLLPDIGGLQVKWPNDVLIGGRKLAGILLDVAADPLGRMTSLVIGCGVNLAVAPELPNRPTACLRDVGIVPPGPERFAHMLLAALDARLAERTRDGLAAIHAAWLTRAHPIGTHLIIHFAGTEIAGDFAGLAPSGHLLLQTDVGIRSLAAGEVLFAPR